jgi:diguanylate cyclase (GGDEF)-like protein
MSPSSIRRNACAFVMIFSQCLLRFYQSWSKKCERIVIGYCALRQIFGVSRVWAWIVWHPNVCHADNDFGAHACVTISTSKIPQRRFVPLGRGRCLAANGRSADDEGGQVPHRKLSLRRRWRKALRKCGAALTHTVGSHPFLAGISGTAVAVAMASLTFVTLYDGRADALRHAHETSENLVSLISSDLARNVEIYDLSLQSMVDGAQDPATWQLPRGLRQSVLFDRATTAAYLGGAYVIDAAGRVAASQDGEINSAVQFDDRDYFLAQQRNPSVGLFVSHPFRSRLRGGKLSIGLTRRINALDGSFAGVALLAIRLEYLQRLLDRINTGTLGAVFIVLDDGTLLARKPFAERDIGTSIARSPTFIIMASHAEGSYVASSAVDGVRRIFTYAHVPNAPLIAVVAPALDDVFAEWRRRSLIAGGLTLALGAVFVMVAWLLAFTLQDKVAAQAELVRLAATDPLTGLSNRRVLDARLDEEWLRARRNRSPMSVLFVDVDHFKLFNDTYGHAAGDEVLAAVAECIASVVRRSLDLVARYGGEEFAVVLPDTSAEGAAHVGEKIRKRVQGMSLFYGQSDRGSVTVSVGCATCLPAEGGSVPALMAQADSQLYAAKLAGRNRVSSTA